MFAISDIVHEVITTERYERKPVKNVQEDAVYKLLTQATTPEIVQKVRDYVIGALTTEDIEADITPKTAHNFLAAAKVVDLDTDPASMKQSTYKIRELTLLRAAPKDVSKGAINMINAFTTPPVGSRDVDIRLANELDPNHPDVVKYSTNSSEYRTLRDRVYTHGKAEATVIPQVAQIIYEVVQERFAAMQNAAKGLSAETAIVFTGSAGTGKSHALRKYAQIHFKDVEPHLVVQGTDNFKNAIRARMNPQFTDEHVHVLGYLTFTAFSEAMKKLHPKLSFIQESWLFIPQVKKLFTDLEASGLKLELHDFDGDIEALHLRCLARLQDKDSPRPPLDRIEYGYKECRIAKTLLYKSLRVGDDYHLTYVNSDGQIQKDKAPESLVTDVEALDRDIAAARNVQITEDHAKAFGDFLKNFEGLTIKDAFEKAKDM